MQERRSTRRWHIRKWAKIKLEGAQHYIDCIINDMNFRGMQILLRQHLLLDKFVKINIMFFEGCECKIEAWIVWRKRFSDTNGYGFYFTKIKDKDKEKIYQFIQSQVPQELKRLWWEGNTEKKGGEEMLNGTSEDKRIFSRFRVVYPLRFIDLDSNREGQAVTENISAKGIAIETERELLPRTPLEMWLQLPDKGQPFYTRGEVVWSKKVDDNRYRTGIELEKADLMGVSRVLRTL